MEKQNLKVGDWLHQSETVSQKLVDTLKCQDEAVIDFYLAFVTFCDSFGVHPNCKNNDRIRKIIKSFNGHKDWKSRVGVK